MKILLVLDSIKYKSHENDSYKDIFRCDVELYFTDYENRIIRFFHGLAFAGNLLSHLSYWLLSAFSALRLIFRNKDKFTHIIFINPIVAFFYCLLASKGGKCKIYLCGFLFAPKSDRLYYNLRKFLVSKSLRYASGIFVYSIHELRVYSELFPDIAGKLIFVRYGRDFNIFREYEYISDCKYIASGGVSSRDYDTLVSAMKLLEANHQALICKIATRPGTCPTASLPGNVKFLFDIRLNRFGSFLEKSEFVVLPLRSGQLSAGHMTLLESMSLGKNIIVADIPSVRDYVDDDLVLFYKPGDVLILHTKLSICITRKTVWFY